MASQSPNQGCHCVAHFQCGMNFCNSLGSTYPTELHQTLTLKGCLCRRIRRMKSGNSQMAKILCCVSVAWMAFLVAGVSSSVSWNWLAERQAMRQQRRHLIVGCVKRGGSWFQHVPIVCQCPRITCTELSRRSPHPAFGWKDAATRQPQGGRS